MLIHLYVQIFKYNKMFILLTKIIILLGKWNKIQDKNYN